MKGSLIKKSKKSQWAIDQTFLKRSSLYFVITCHVVALSWLIYSASSIVIDLNPHPLKVQTVQLKKQGVIAAAPKPKPKPKATPTAEVKPAPKVTPKKTTKKAEVKPIPKATPKAEVKPKPTKKPTTTAHSEQHAKTSALQKAKETLAQMSNSPAKIGGGDRSFAHSLSEQLRRQLKLPEYGAVKVDLTIARGGKVQRIEILRAESNVNKRYVEKMLAGATFNGFNAAFPGEEEHTFTLVLSNDI